MSKINIGLLIAILVVIIAGGVYFFIIPKEEMVDTQTKSAEPIIDTEQIEPEDSFVTTTATSKENIDLVSSTTNIINSSSTISMDTATTTAPATLPRVRITTNKGDIVVELFAQDAPKTVENFLKLTEKKYYDGVIFHRVIKDFMIQGGDPTGTGMGGPEYTFADELNPETESYKRGYVRGTLAMANAGPNTNGSQFFIVHNDYPLPNNYTIFGRVVTGLEVVDAIADSKTGAHDRPVEDIVMTKVEVLK
jgi:cyclophilin family peptidyl-prolyl cis-trans isomerase